MSKTDLSAGTRGKANGAAAAAMSAAWTPERRAMQRGASSKVAKVAHWKRWRDLPAKTIQFVKQLARQGMSLEQIIAKAGVTRHAAYAIRKDIGVVSKFGPKRQPIRAKKDRPMKHTSSGVSSLTSRRDKLYARLHKSSRQHFTRDELRFLLAYEDLIDLSKKDDVE
jgi:hypothetical protein